ncbi:leucine-rich repeat domain-containing protein [Ruminococcus sp. zg-924]|uniref:leucine-rich repeat domain-containing protein n=1 Tax=Ruminococcus sp. zg-924 TaxID=2678505 RepID=UPI00210DF843|nr:leucine-rich repeat domain-containing protein [Ruminococcus sp. zg-924]
MNSKKQIQKFYAEEYDDYVVLRQYISNDINFVEIPSKINNKKVTVIGDSCFFNHPEIVVIVFPSTIVSIGKETFALCKGIKEFDLPDSITEIGVHAFRDCTGLKKVVMPKHLKILSAGIFAFCYLPTDVEMILPEELEEIDVHAFYSGGSFELIIPNTVKKIGVGAFNWGPKVITSLPYDKGWYLDWPYGEKVILGNEQIGVISDLQELGNGCNILEVTVNQEKCKVFYPCIHGKEFSFEDEKNQRMMENDIKDNDGIQDTYEAWRNGLI